MIRRTALAASLLLFAFIASLAPASAQFADQSTYVAASTGSSNAYVVAVPNATTNTDLQGVVVKFLPNFTNTNAATINFGFGAIAIRKPTTTGPTALTGGEIVTGSPSQMVAGVFDGTYFQLIGNLNAVPPVTGLTPQGYLTPCQMSSGSPVTGCTAGGMLPTGDVTAATALYYEPAFGNTILIWNGSAYVAFAFTETHGTLTLGSSNLANTLYDVCMFSNAGTPAIGTSVAWTSSAAGSSARGTGAATAQVALINGLWTNAVSTTVRNGATSTVVPANQCTIVATILMGGTNGQISFTRTFGQNRVWPVWNFYNQQATTLKVGDATASWVGGTARACRGTSANAGTALTGLPVPVDTEMTQSMSVNVPSTSGVVQSGIGLNSTTTFSGKVGYVGAGITSGNTDTRGDGKSAFTTLPILGVNTINCVENTSGAGTLTFYGTEANMLLTIKQRM